MAWNFHGVPTCQRRHGGRSEYWITSEMAACTNGEPSHHKISYVKVLPLVRDQSRVNDLIFHLPSFLYFSQPQHSTTWQNSFSNFQLKKFNHATNFECFRQGRSYFFFTLLRKKRHNFSFFVLYSLYSFSLPLRFSRSIFQGSALFVFIRICWKFSREKMPRFFFSRPSFLALFLRKVKVSSCRKWEKAGEIYIARKSATKEAEGEQARGFTSKVKQKATPSRPLPARPLPRHRTVPQPGFLYAIFKNGEERRAAYSASYFLLNNTKQAN